MKENYTTKNRQNTSTIQSNQVPDKPNDIKGKKIEKNKPIQYHESSSQVNEIIDGIKKLPLDELSRLTKEVAERKAIYDIIFQKDPYLSIAQKKDLAEEIINKEHEIELDEKRRLQLLESENEIKAPPTEMKSTNGAFHDKAESKRDETENGTENIQCPGKIRLTGNNRKFINNFVNMLKEAAESDPDLSFQCDTDAIPDMIQRSFVNKNGKPLSYNTIRQYIPTSKDTRVKH
ncbi:MAG: hypothetical protein HXX14_21615 [Bacteroidetes bacterium]|nr:hypothetical protein [Bacteroidota bacterium]NWJ53445.1 hypothetical protein [Bacteroidota bacterium]